MAQRDEIRRRTESILRSVGRVRGPLPDDTRLVADLGLESIQILELIVAIERAFDIRIDEREVVPIITIGDLIGAIAQRVDVSR